MDEQIVLTTSRLTLKSITPATIHFAFINNTEEVIKQLFGADANGFLRLKDMYEKGMETHNISFYYFLLLDTMTGRVIGECGFHSWNKAHNRAELFYNLKYDSDKQKGLMTEAVNAVLNFGFIQLNLHRIEALTADYNIPSRKLLAHFGFTKEGTMREDYIVDGKYENSVCYSLLKWEFRNKEDNPEADVSDTG